MHDTLPNTEPPSNTAKRKALRHQREAAELSQSRQLVRHLARRSLVAFNRIYVHTFHSLDVRTPCLLPQTGPAILVCNHTSGLDPLLIQSVSPRLVRWMMAREYYEQPALRWMFDLIDAIPVDRTGRDVASTRAALRTLSQGQILGVFPEGKIETTRQLLPFQTGVAMLASKMNVPIYTAALDGTQRGRTMLRAFSERQTATLRFGPTIEAPGRKTDLKELTARLEKIVRDLMQMLGNSPL